jgi:AcrR family transcriptional regulator
VDGLDGLSIGNLAAAAGMSKSGLSAYFASKQELQLGTVAQAARIFDTEVVQRSDRLLMGHRGRRGDRGGIGC